MSVCEKCWSDAYMRMMAHPSKSQTEHYLDLLEERKDKPCQEEGGTMNSVESCKTCKWRGTKKCDSPYPPADDDWCGAYRRRTK